MLQRLVEACKRGPCLGEVSGKDSGHPLRLVKRVNGNLDFIFEDLGSAANSYNVYQGVLGTWYSHVSGQCHNTATAANTPAPGDRTWSNYATGSTAAYFLISASNASSEGVLGEDSQSNLIPPPSPQCGPNP